ncbi:MAG: D-glycero-beta-D-manno-heptose 1-phosphate adenylyltransferase [Tissierellia bacterium]|nr:D-glycero-beta-D-manno-heptose 1-phosphate adenylyltransferase [Tissierellia bacterium]
MINKLCKLENKKILVVGDILIDHYININPKKISEEYPGIVFNYENDYYKLGGAGNVANNLSKFNISVDIVSLAGKDSNLEILNKMLKENYISNKYLIIDSNYKTSIKDRYYSKENKQIIRIDNEINYFDNYDKIKSTLKDAFNNRYDAIVISDYRKGLITDEIFNYIIELANKNNTIVICDPKDGLVKYHDLFVLKPNERELREILNGDINYEKVFEYKNKNNIKNLVLTLGENGIKLFEENNEIKTIKGIKQEIFDVTGAGDIVLAYICIGILAGLSMIELCEIANKAGSKKVTKFGTQTISLNDIHPLLINTKLLERNLINNYCKLIHKDNKKIVFTNGCFDIIHSGHLYLLKEAKKMGDVLIVGLNSDDSIKRLKGDKRPINNISERIEILNSFDFIDYIVVFEEDSPLEIIKLVNPDILVKGSDYKDKYVIGTNEVIQNGGELRFVNLIQDKSTSNIIKKIIGDTNV